MIILNKFKIMDWEKAVHIQKKATELAKIAFIGLEKWSDPKTRIFPFVESEIVEALTSSKRYEIGAATFVLPKRKRKTTTVYRIETRLVHVSREIHIFNQTSSGGQFAKIVFYRFSEDKLWRAYFGGNRTIYTTFLEDQELENEIARAVLFAERKATPQKAAESSAPGG